MKRYKNLTLKPHEARRRVWQHCDAHFKKHGSCEGCQYFRPSHCSCSQEHVNDKTKEHEYEMLLREAKSYLGELGFEPGGKSFNAGLVLLGSMIVGGDDALALSLWSKVPLEQVQEFGERLRANGVWKDGKVHANWLDEKEGGVSFILDVFAAVGMVEQREDEVVPAPET
jgi:hypothetical protein